MKTCFDNKTVSEQLMEDEDYGYKHWMYFQYIYLDDMYIVFPLLSPKKRKRFRKGEKSIDISLDLAPQGASLADDEELALQLLTGS